MKYPQCIELLDVFFDFSEHARFDLDPNPNPVKMMIANT